MDLPRYGYELLTFVLVRLQWVESSEQTKTMWIWWHSFHVMSAFVVGFHSRITALHILEARYSICLLTRTHPIIYNRLLAPSLWFPRNFARMNFVTIPLIRPGSCVSRGVIHLISYFKKGHFSRKHPSLRSYSMTGPPQWNSTSRCPT